MDNKIFYLILVFLTISCGAHKVITKKDLLYNSTSENLDKFGSFIWLKNKNDSIIINKQNLDIIKLKKDQYSKSIIKYTDFLRSPRYNIKNINFSERSKILAHIIFYMKDIEYDEKQYSLIENVIFRDIDFKYYNEFEKQDYYNLPNFKDQYRETFQKLKPPKKLEVIKPILKIEKQD
jgi:hypothetical protein